MSAQLNVSHVFNRYTVLVMPNPTPGFNGPRIATIDSQPRAHQVTSTLSF